MPANKPALHSIWQVEVLLSGSWRNATSVLLSNGRYRIVVDTGMAHEAHQLVKALEEQNLRPEDITHLVNTHFHIDHVLNNILFTNSIIYGSQQSYDWCCAMYSDIKDEANWEKLVLKYYPETFDYERAQENMVKLRKIALRWWDVKRLGPRSQFRWIENTPLPEGLEAIVTHGHVPGNLSLLINPLAGDGATIIAGDALLSRDRDEQVVTMIPHNRKQYELDRERVLSLGKSIIPGHGCGFVAGGQGQESGT